MFSRVRRALGLATVLFAGLIGLGCGGGKSSVSGKVTHAGKTVVWGAVTLVDPTGTYHQADIDLEGNYRLHKVSSGVVKIGVTSPNPEPPAGRTPSERGGGGAAKPKPPAGAWFPIPVKYADPTSSDLTGDVKGGTSVLNIDLK